VWRDRAAKHIRDVLGEPHARIVTCGSLRRGTEDVGDVDLLVVREGDLGALVHDVGDSADRAGLDVVGYWEGDMHVDVYRCDPDQVGPFALFLTGPADFNIVCRRKANALGMSLSQHGLFMDGERVDEPTSDIDAGEREVMRLLGRAFIPPEVRDVWRECWRADD
jgi:DNA polymerase/3'-5' exonuclease PolX